MKNCNLSAQCVLIFRILYSRKGLHLILYIYLKH
nr:MAG TPA: hypothetical protein [Caudoviricetes sp.]